MTNKPWETNPIYLPYLPFDTMKTRIVSQYEQEQIQLAAARALYGALATGGYLRPHAMINGVCAENCKRCVLERELWPEGRKP